VRLVIILTYRVTGNLSVSFKIHGAYSIIEARHCQYGIDIQPCNQMVTR
jgi:hypothetical protein